MRLLDRLQNHLRIRRRRHRLGFHIIVVGHIGMVETQFLDQFKTALSRLKIDADLRLAV